MTKVISFSLWGEDPKYTRGAIRNAELAQEIYPDWECWFYMNDDEFAGGEFWIDELINVGDHVSIKLVRSEPDWRMMFDRFTAILDPRCEAMIVRDCDSRLTAREAAAVAEWLASDKTFHAMRDHPHHSVPILGGMWGMKGGVVDPAIYSKLLSDWPKEDRWQTDQEWLAAVIWARYMRDIMVHDDGFLTNYFGGKRFPTARLESGEFVGATYDANDVIDADQLAAIKGVIG